MNCEIIKDLIPLYIDRCCSKESANEVEKHLKECKNCKSIFDMMNSENLKEKNESFEIKKLSKINERKASVLQSVLLFISFIVMTVGVTLEAKTPLGTENGFWAFTLIIPATGFLLSLANWFFIKIYKNKKIFSVCSFIVNAAITLFFFICGIFYYNVPSLYFISETGFSGFDVLLKTIQFLGCGIVTAAVFCAVSKIFSLRYAELLGKD